MADGQGLEGDRTHEREGRRRRMTMEEPGNLGVRPDLCFAKVEEQAELP
jgi:hypothetical protein